MNQDLKTITISRNNQVSNNNSEMPKPKVIIDRTCLAKIRYLVDKDNQEISGLGLTRIDGDTIYIEDVKMLEQKNGAAHTDIEAEAAAKIMYDWRERNGEVNFWWHSHVDMSTFWSGQDMTTIKQLGGQGLCVAAVFNKRGEIRTAVSCKVKLPFSSAEQIMIWDEIPMMVKDDIPDSLKEEWNKEHQENVKKFVPQYQTQWPNRGPSTGRQAGGDLGVYKRFFPVKTHEPDYWDSMDQAKENEVFYMCTSCRFDNAKGKYHKSTKQIACEQAFAKGHTLTSINQEISEYNWMVIERWAREPAIVGSETINELKNELDGADAIREIDRDLKYQYAEKRPEILAYDEKKDVFDLWDGNSINADYYLGPKGKTFRDSRLKRYQCIFGTEKMQSTEQEEKLHEEVLLASEEDWRRGGQLQ